MQKLKIILLAIFISFGVLTSGCQAPLHVREAEKIGQMVYATGDSIDAGRIDLAKAYNEPVKKYFGEPKKRIEITPIKRKDATDNVVILPKGLKGKEVIVVETAEWKKLLEDNPKLVSQLAAEKKTVAAKDKELEVLAAEKKAAIAEAEAEKKNKWFWRILGSLGIGIPTLVIVGLIVLSIFFPPAFGIAIKVITGIFEFLVKAVRNLIAAVNTILEYFNKKKEG